MDKTRSPGGRGFKLKFHDTQPDAPLSPVYVNLRPLRSHPQLMRHVVGLYQQMIRAFEHDLLADIPVAASPIVAVLMDRTGTPMITPRQPKERGTMASIEGAFNPGQIVVLADDLITKAHSKIEAAKILRTAGLIVNDVVVLVDREQGGRAQLAEAGMNLHAAFTLMELLEFYHSSGLMSQEMYDEVVTYLSGN